MEIIMWSDKLSTGISAIDSHHQILINYINHFHVINTTGNTKESGESLNKLIKYTAEHFNFEENLMLRNNYQGMLVHKSAHTALTAQVNQLSGKRNKGQSELRIHLIDFLKDWLTNHILGEDMKFGAFLVKKGLR